MAVVHAGRSNLQTVGQLLPPWSINITHRLRPHIQPLSRHWKNELRSFRMQIQRAKLQRHSVSITR